MVQLLFVVALISMTTSLEGADSITNDNAFKLTGPSFNVLDAKSMFIDLQHAVWYVSFVANMLSSDSRVP